MPDTNDESKPAQGPAEEPRQATPPHLRPPWQNATTLIGAFLASLAALFLVSFLVIGRLRPAPSPYIGLWTYLVIPVILAGGLGLMPIGLLLRRRKYRKLYPHLIVAAYPRLDLNDRRQRAILLSVMLATVVLIPIVGVISYQAYHFTDSSGFCGQLCHTVMSPEFTTYRHSPHARVECAACHIGPGATWFVKSKLSGLRQVYATVFETYPRPIPLPIVSLRPSRETCEQCHWPEKFYGDQLMKIPYFESDEKNTRREVQMLVRTGGGDPSMGPVGGIHWHMAVNAAVKYVATDPQRQEITWVRWTDPTTGKVTVYRSDGRPVSDPPPEGEMRDMDCMDCHNRPTHVVRSPQRAVNLALEARRMDRTVPFIKRQAVLALTQADQRTGNSDEAIRRSLTDYYQSQLLEVWEAKQEGINQAIETVQALYRQNFFPHMKVNWRTYPNNAGHKIFPGCFRCHDGKHVDAKGQPLSHACKTCHDFLETRHTGESDEATIIDAGEFNHPVELKGRHAELMCHECHTGGPAPERTCQGCHKPIDDLYNGRLAGLAGLEAKPNVMAESAGCEECHDLDEPITLEKLDEKCVECHEEEYPGQLGTWRRELADALATATDAVEQVRGLLDKAPADAAKWVSETEEFLRQLTVGVPMHNPDLVKAACGLIRKRAAGFGATPRQPRVPTTTTGAE